MEVQLFSSYASRMRILDMKLGTNKNGFRRALRTTNVRISLFLPTA